MERCKCGNKGFSDIEYSYDHPEHYDGVSEEKCQKCGTRYGRWTGKILKEGECEKVYGGKR